MNNKSLDFRENSSLVCCCFLHLSGKDNTLHHRHDTKIKVVWLPKALGAKGQQLLPLKVGQILALNYFKVPLLRVNLLTTMMYNTECLIYPCQTRVISRYQATVLSRWKWLLLTHCLRFFQPCSPTEGNSYRKQIYPLVNCSGIHCAICVEKCWDNSFYWKLSERTLSGGDENGGDSCCMRGNPIATNGV